MPMRNEQRGAPSAFGAAYVITPTHGSRNPQHALYALRQEVAAADNEDEYAEDADEYERDAQWHEADEDDGYNDVADDDGGFGAPGGGSGSRDDDNDEVRERSGGGGARGGRRAAHGATAANAPRHGRPSNMYDTDDIDPNDDNDEFDDHDDGAAEGGDGGGIDDEEGEGAAAMDEADYEPTDQEISEYCEWLNMDPIADRQLMWIAREALKAPLPENWRQCYTDDREVYYFNMRTGESIWDHPMDAYYKALFKQEKAKLDKKRRHMRLFDGSMEIKPMAEFFSDISDTCGLGMGDELDDPDAPWRTVPENLIDAIDFRIYIDPVVLPPSGRTVSRHTIINNKWRDPFSREYIDNRRLVPNVDKRSEVESWINTMMAKYMAHLTPDARGLQRLLRIAPFMLDKEEEGCVRGQRLLLDFFKEHLRAPVVGPQEMDESSSAAAQEAQTEVPLSARSAASDASHSSAGGRHAVPRPGISHKSGGGATGAAAAKGSSFAAKKIANARLRDRAMQQRRRTDSVRAKLGATATPSSHQPPPPPPPPPPPTLLELIEALEDSELGVLLGALLTMSSSSSREALLLLLKRAPKLACHATFRGFSDAVLNVLHIAAQDLSRIATTVISASEAEFEARQRRQPPGLRDGAGGTSTSIRSSTETLPYTASVPQLPHLRGSAGAPPPCSPTAPARLPQPPQFGGVAGVPEEAAQPSLLPESKEELFAGHHIVNSEHVLALDWVHTLATFDPPVNALRRLEFSAVLHLACAIFATPELQYDASAVTALLRGAEGWPVQLGACGDSVIRMLTFIATWDTAPLSQVTTLFDICLHGGERAMDLLVAEREGATARHGAPSVRENVLHLARHVPRGGAVAPSPIDMLAAVMIFHEQLSLGDVAAANPAVALRVGANLSQRLTRSQWRPKHFHRTVTALIRLVEEHPELAWATFASRGLLFFLRELSKKKSNNDELRQRLETIEARERQLEQSDGHARWAVLAARATLAARRAAVVNHLATHDKERCARVPMELRAGGGGPSASDTAAPPEPRSTADPAPVHAPLAHAGSVESAASLPIGAHLDKLRSRRQELLRKRAENVAAVLAVLLQIRLKPKQRGGGDARGASGVGGASPSGKHASALCSSPPNGAAPMPPPPPPSSSSSAFAGPRTPMDSGRRRRGSAALGDSSLAASGTWGASPLASLASVSSSAIVASRSARGNAAAGALPPI